MENKCCLLHYNSFPEHNLCLCPELYPALKDSSICKKCHFLLNTYENPKLCNILNFPNHSKHEDKICCQTIKYYCKC